MRNYFAVKPPKNGAVYCAQWVTASEIPVLAEASITGHSAETLVNLLGYGSRIACSGSIAPELLSSEKCQGLLAYRLCLASRGTLFLDESWLLCTSRAPWCCYGRIRMGEADAGVVITTV